DRLDRLGEEEADVEEREIAARVALIAHIDQVFQPELAGEAELRSISRSLPRSRTLNGRAPRLNAIAAPCRKRSVRLCAPMPACEPKTKSAGVTLYLARNVGSFGIGFQ